MPEFLFHTDEPSTVKGKFVKQEDGSEFIILENGTQIRVTSKFSPTPKEIDLSIPFGKAYTK